MEDDASLDAEVFVNKASPFINAIDDLSLQLRYKVTYARVMDANRKFLDAAIRYYELSTAVHANVLRNKKTNLNCNGFIPTCTYVLYAVPADRPGRAAGAARQGCDLRRARQSWTAESASDDAAAQSIHNDCFPR